MFPKRDLISTEIPVTTKTTKFVWPANWPQPREWIGSRYIHQLNNQDWFLSVTPKELTLAIKRDDIEDDQIQMQGPIAENIGFETEKWLHRDAYQLLTNGVDGLCFDGQPFFHGSHPNGDTTYSNYQAGAGAAWYVLMTTAPLKPLIWGNRRAIKFTRIESDENESVFNRAEYLYGTDARWGYTYAFPFLAYRSEAPLTMANVKAAIVTMNSYTNEDGVNLGIMPDTLLVPGSLQFEALELMTHEKVMHEGTLVPNSVRGALDAVVCPYL